MNKYILSATVKTLVLALVMLATGVLTAKPFSVVLDAGHGGKDYGAIGKTTNEKSINLAVVKLIAEYLENNYPEIVVLLTRGDDTYLTLKERADFANKNSGDLFVSVHVNSVDKKNRNRTTIEGASVYTLGLHKTDANFEVAKRENSVISLEDESSANYEGFDPNSTESYIIFEMSQNKHMGQSVNLASRIQNELISTAGRADRGVRQAGFWVLWATVMPSVLVELDFICNPTQEKFLSSKAGQNKMASAIGRAIGAYASSHSEVSPYETTPILSVTVTDKDSDYETVVTEEQVIAVKPTEKKETTKNKKALTFHVQILASAKSIKKNSSEFKGYKPKEFKEGKWYKYYVGEFSNISEARAELEKVKKKFPEAFIIKMQQGKRVKE